jgi:hypothetical protein
MTIDYRDRSMPRISNSARTLKSVCVTASLLAAVACGQGSSPTALTPTRASFTVSVTPSPVTAERCNPQCLSTTGAAFAFSAPFTVRLQESTGIGANVNSVTVTGSTGAVTFAPVVFGSTEILQEAGSNHVGPRGSLAIPINIVYTTPAGTPNLTLNISVQLTDDQNHQVTASSQVNVI